MTYQHRKYGRALEDGGSDLQRDLRPQSGWQLIIEAVMVQVCSSRTSYHNPAAALANCS